MEGGGVIFLALMAGLYFLPAIVANLRGHQNDTAIGALNFLLGWTLAGWVVAMVWSLMAVEAPVRRGRPMPPAKAALHGALDIEYRDAEGDRTERYIEAISLRASNGQLYLYGWCEMRQALRTFRVDRIRALTDGETGEIIPRAEIAGWLRERAGLEG